MKINKLTILMLLSLAFAGCIKSANSNPAPGTVYTIQGVAKYYDYVKMDTVTLDSQLIYIKHWTDSADTFYIYAVQTDINGYFTFYNLPDTNKYIIYTKEPEKSINPSFTGTYSVFDTTFIFPKDTIILVAQDKSRENGIMVAARDTSGDTIAGASVAFYTSKAVALLDTFCTGAGSIATLTTDVNGNGFIGKLPAGAIYINAVLRVNGSNILGAIADSTILAQHGLTGTSNPFNAVKLILMPE